MSRNTGLYLFITAFLFSNLSIMNSTSIILFAAVLRSEYQLFPVSMQQTLIKGLEANDWTYYYGDRLVCFINLQAKYYIHKTNIIKGEMRE